MDVDGSVVLVTGASSGIGAATARAMAAEGALVLLVARSTPDLESVAREIESSGGRAAVYPVDLADTRAVEDLAATITETHGTPDVLVNNAGIGRFTPIEETSPEDAVAMVEVPYLAAYRVTRAFIEGMLARDSGHVVNLTSAAAYVPWPGSTAYAASRWAIRGFSEALDTDLGESGVNVSLVAATTVESPYWEHNPDSREKLPAIASLFGLLSPDDVARAIVSAVESERREVLVPRSFHFAAVLARIFPGLFRWVTGKTGWRRPTSAR